MKLFCSMLFCTLNFLVSLLIINLFNVTFIVFKFSVYSKNFFGSQRDKFLDFSSKCVVFAEMDLENFLLLPPEVLNEQKCTDCLNYLSVGPVMITKDDKTICGRCVLKHKITDELKISLYNQIAEGCVFSCVNRFDGCIDMLSFDETMQHESTCTGTVYSCPFCSFKGNSCQFKQHCDIDHIDQVIKDGVFKIKTEDCNDSEDNLIYFDFDDIFIIKRAIKCGILKLSVEMLTLTNVNLKLYKYHFRFFVSNFKRNGYRTSDFDLSMDKLAANDYEIDIKTLVNRLASSISCRFILNRNITNILETRVYELKRMCLTYKQKLSEREAIIKEGEEKIMLERQTIAAPYKTIRKLIRVFYTSALQCVNCDLQIIEIFSSFVCPQWHICCSNCLNKYCNMCRNPCHWTTFANFFPDLSCDWKNCKVNSKVHEYLLHKQICNFRQYECPLDDCNFKGTTAELIAHRHINEIVFKTGRSVDVDVNQQCEIFWMIDYFYELIDIQIKTDTVGSLHIFAHENRAICPDKYNIALYRYSTSRYCYEYLDLLKQKGDTKQYSFNNPSGYHQDGYRLIVCPK